MDPAEYKGAMIGCKVAVPLKHFDQVLPLRCSKPFGNVSNDTVFNTLIRLVKYDVYMVESYG